jgi:hypothetical protein
MSKGSIILNNYLNNLLMDSRRANLSSAQARSDYIKTSQDFFTKRNNINMLKSNNLSPLKKNDYLSTINVLKTDIIQLDNIYKKISDILIYYRLDFNEPSYSIINNVNIAFQKKVKELQINVNNFSKNETFSKITENSKNLDFLFKEFKCITKDELINRLALEYFFDELIIERANDIALLINLKNFNENQSYVNNYKENLSKIYNLKNLLEMINQGSNNLAFSIDRENASVFSYDCESQIIFESEFVKILEMKNLSELLEYRTDNNLLGHIKDLVLKFYDKIYFIFDDLAKQLFSNNGFSSYRNSKSDDLLANLFCIRENMEKVIKHRENEYDAILERNKILMEQVTELTKNNNYLINEVVNKLETHNENIETYINKLYSDKILKLENELQEQSKQLIRAKDTIFVINEDLKYTNAKVAKKQNLNQSYDKLVIEQFDNMKASFIKKIENLSDELVKIKHDHKTAILKLENELAVVKQMKDLFMSQIISIKKNYN